MSLRLIIAATRRELAPLLEKLEGGREVRLRYGEAVSGCLHDKPLVLAWLGVGKVNSAAGLALASEQLEPAAVVQLGIGGAFAGSGVRIGEVAVASEEIHLDSGVRTADGFSDMESLGFPLLSTHEPFYNRIPVDRPLSTELAGGRYALVPFGTSETVTGEVSMAGPAHRFGVAVESMEGAAAAQVALALGLPFAELRGISNEVGERDKTRWRTSEAIEAGSSAVEEWLKRGAQIGRQ